jgi:(p)ppGpp synthase/HD superfamily hydrolase
VGDADLAQPDLRRRQAGGVTVRLTARFDEALAYAAEVHRDHVRKDTAIPYIAHLLAVTALVLEDGGDEDQAIAALLHDAPEDRGGRARLADIAVRFGPGVAAIVEACTDTFVHPKPPYVERKREHLRRLRRQGTPGALRVTAADKLHNARAILADHRALGDALFARFTAGKAGTLWYYGCAARLLGDRLPGALASELARVVADLRAAAAPGLAAPASEDDDPRPVG